MVEKEILNKTPSIKLEGYDTPINLDKGSFLIEDLEGLALLWKDEPSAEELVKQL